MQRENNRRTDQLRQITFDTAVNMYAEGSVLISYGNTMVLCTATVEPGVPFFLRGKGSGWVTAEYAMLPRSTLSRNKRESTQGKTDGRRMEIQRLVGRSLRTAVDLKQLGAITITIDCDVIQADGGTRTAAITGGYVSMVQALRHSKKADSIRHAVAAVSVGIVNNAVLLDLDYQEDSSAETDLNLVMTNENNIIEIQGTAERQPFDKKQLDEMIALGQKGIEQLLKLQQNALA